MSTSPEARRHWLPLPILAVPVRVVLDADSNLDGLERALLGLLRLHARDPVELSRKLHVPIPLVRSALARLGDQELVAAPDDADGLFSCAPDVGLVPAEAARPGWAFYAPATKAFLPAVVLGERTPGDGRFPPPRGTLTVDGARAQIDKVPWPVLERTLQSLHATRDVLVLHRNRRASATAAGANGIVLAGRELPVLAASAPSERLRSMVIEHRGERNLAKHTAWLPIDLLPRMRGHAVVVIHEPVIDPETQLESPIHATLADWMERSDPAAWVVVQAERERVRIDMSLVLRLAGIESEDALEHEVDRHARELATVAGVDELRAPPGDAQLLTKIRDAQRWLVLAQRDHSLRAQASDAWSHAIEELCAALSVIAQPHLSRWNANKRRMSPTKADAERRLLDLRLRRQLGPSEHHLLRWVNEPSDRVDTSAAGAGANLTRWLLPLLLLDDRAAGEYAVHVRLALGRNPQLFEDLDQLLAVRDFAFHEGRTRSASKIASDLPEHIERTFLSVFGALHAGLDGAPVPAA